MDFDKDIGFIRGVAYTVALLKYPLKIRRLITASL